MEGIQVSVSALNYRRKKKKRKEERAQFLRHINMGQKDRAGDRSKEDLSLTVSEIQESLPKFCICMHFSEKRNPEGERSHLLLEHTRAEELLQEPTSTDVAAVSSGRKGRKEQAAHTSVSLWTEPNHIPR